MRTKTFSAKRLLSLVLTVAMFATMILPTGVFAADNGTITTDLGEKTIVKGETVEFTVSSTKNEVGGTIMIKGKFAVEASDTDIASIEYYETTESIEGWYPFTTSYDGTSVSGKFGPELTGFPMMDATSKFRVTFANAGTYKVTVSAVKVEDDSELCSETVNVTVYDGYADYTELEDAITVAGGYNSGDYTTASYKELTDAVEKAEKAINDKWTSDKQDDVDALVKAINDAIAGLVKNVEVSFTAVAVADNASVDYAKANKIVLVFAEPVNDAANELVSKLNIKDEVSVANWTTNTVYTLTLKDDHSLTNNAEVTFDGDETIFTVSGSAMADTKANVIGNLEEAYQQVTATKMAATIVKSSDKPGVVEGDKIVLVFNAPVYKNPDNITVSGLTAKVVEGTYNTVYEITLDGTENVSDDTKLTYETIANVELNGTFGKAVAPKVLNAVAVDVDGTAKTEGDLVVIVFDRPTNGSVDISNLTDFVDAKWNTTNTELTLTVGVNATIGNGATLDIASMGIKDKDDLVDATNTSVKLAGSFGIVTAPVALRAYAIDNDGTELVYNKIDGTVYKDQIIVVFDTPTNEANDISKIRVIGTGYTASLGTEAELNWEEDGTKLVITLGKDTVIKNGATIDFTNLGIMDKDNIVAADSASLKLDIEGSFGYTTQPRIVKAIAFSQGSFDYIRVFFNTSVKEDDGIKDEPTFSNEFEMGSGAEFGIVSSNGMTYYEIKMEKSAHTALKPGTTIALTGIADNDTGTKFVSDTPYEISGGFVSPITPEVVDVIALSQDGSGIAKSGDKILVIFNVAVEGGNITLLNNNLGDNRPDDEIEGNVLTMTLGENTTVKVGDKIRVSDFVDSATLSAKMATKEIAIGGTFGKIIEPKVLSITAISKDGSGVAKAGDEIVAVFNTSVKVTHINGTPVTEKTGAVYTYVLTEVGEYEVGDAFKLTVESVDTGLTYVLDKVGKEETDAIVGGSFGEKAEPKVKSVVLSETAGTEVITVIFDRATKVETALIDQTAFKNNNTHLDVKAATWNNDGTVLTIELGENATTKETETGTDVPGDVLNLSGLGIKSTDTNEDVLGLEKLSITGSLIPVVTSAKVIGTTITVDFSARTNGSRDALEKIKQQTALYGSGVDAVWTEGKNNKQLKITMSEDNALPLDAYIVLNDLGIKDGFSNSVDVIGQYKLDTRDMKRNLLDAKVYVLAANTTDERTNFTTGLVGDKILVMFDAPTNRGGNTNDNADAKAFVELKDSSETLGEGYTAIWKDASTIEIVLGTGATFTTNNKIIIKNVKFANNTGILSESGNGTVSNEKSIEGQFDGRDFWIEDLDNDGDGIGGIVRYTATIQKAPLFNMDSEKEYYVICQAFNADNAVISVNAIKILNTDKMEVAFDFNKANLSKVNMFVLTGDYRNAEEAIGQCSEVESK